MFILYDVQMITFQKHLSVYTINFYGYFSKCQQVKFLLSGYLGPSNNNQLLKMCLYILYKHDVYNKQTIIYYNH